MGVKFIMWKWNTDNFVRMLCAIWSCWRLSWKFTYISHREAQNVIAYWCYQDNRSKLTRASRIGSSSQLRNSILQRMILFFLRKLAVCHQVSSPSANVSILTQKLVPLDLPAGVIQHLRIWLPIKDHGRAGLGINPVPIKAAGASDTIHVLLAVVSALIRLGVIALRLSVHATAAHRLTHHSMDRQRTPSRRTSISRCSAHCWRSLPRSSCRMRRRHCTS